jgi:hypothetical protein
MLGVFAQYGVDKVSGNNGNGVDSSRAAIDFRQLKSTSYKAKYIDDQHGGEDQSHHIVMAIKAGYNFGIISGSGGKPDMGFMDA